jgi:hypothetical protein
MSLTKLIVAKMLLDESESTQNAKRKIAGVRISAGLIRGRYFFMYIMGK